MRNLLTCQVGNGSNMATSQNQEVLSSSSAQSPSCSSHSGGDLETGDPPRKSLVITAVFQNVMVTRVTIVPPKVSSNSFKDERRKTEILGCQCIWPSKNEIQNNMPDAFHLLYPATRVILDCTELFVQTPTSLLLQSELYSSYKSNTTLKGLIGITPHGAISCISPLYTGSISDKEITRCSGILDLLEHGDSVMADKGFNIDDLLKEKGVGLNIPPFLQSQAQFSAQDVHETKTIAKLRIHVEIAIRRIKEFHFFDSEEPLSSLGSVNQLYTVACLLTNFQGPLTLNSTGKT